MSDSADRVPISGSERDPLPGAKRVGPVDPDATVSVSLLLRSPAPQGAAAHLAELAEETPQPLGQRLSRKDFAAQHGAADDDIAKVRAFAEASGLEVVEESAARRTVVLRGDAARASAAFDVELAQYEHPGGEYRGREGVVTVPSELEGIVQGVFGLDARPQAQPRLRRAKPSGQGGAAAPHAVGGFTPPEVAQLYDFPPGNGSGECIALIELGGGYEEHDLADYFAQLQIKAPTVVAVGVDGATNAPGGGPNSADGEVVLDIDVAGAIANGARIAVYFAPNTDQGFLDAITTAVHDAENNPSVISISWGSAEENWTSQAMDAMDAAFADAALMGITVCAAAGDNGSADGLTDGKAHADFPASAPHALGCGGTRLTSNGGSIASEEVWNDGSGGATGGGVSSYFALPLWQRSAGVRSSVNGGDEVKRGVPDVAGDADPGTGYRIHIDGSDPVFGGTSAVAPLWAALLAIVNEQRGQRVGLVHPALYAGAAATFHDIVEGENGVPGTPGYQAAVGWDPCTGLGTPDGVALLAAL